MIIFAIDPGPEKSAFVVYDMEDKRIIDANILENRGIKMCLQSTQPTLKHDCLAIEMIASYGMPVGASVFETCVWIGRFIEVRKCRKIVRINRISIKNHICHSSRAKDSNIRQAIIDMYGGKTKAIGLKKTPGPLYGFKADMWAALAVAITAAAQIENSELNKEQKHE